MEIKNLLEASEVASIIGIKKETLRSWRAKRVGPPFIKIQKTIRYDEDDLYEYLNNKAKGTTCITK